MKWLISGAAFGALWLRRQAKIDRQQSDYIRQVVASLGEPSQTTSRMIGGLWPISVPSKSESQPEPLEQVPASFANFLNEKFGEDGW